MATEYTILITLSPGELVKLVNEHIKQGWQPIGGVQMQVAPPIDGQAQTYSLQAMVK